MNNDSPAPTASAPAPRLPRELRPTARDVRLFHEGRHYDLHRKLGAHRATLAGSAGVAFAVWAPNAVRVSVIGSFNGWSAGDDPLRPIGQSGIWAGFVPGVECDALYKFHIESRHDGYRVDKSDPFAFRSQTPPASASVVCTLDYDWGDAEWLARREARGFAQHPMAVYELHLGSWRRPTGQGERLPSYDEIGDRLIPYLQRMGFTHVELLPLMEHPYYGSWGYQSTGYFAASSRYGSPQELMRLIDRLHQHEIGVILDWVPSHFPSDEHGLGFFDGTRVYEYADPRLGYHRDWDSYIFDYGRNEVRSFLISSALFWIERYHADALRVDAVASMLYLDYSRPDGDWIANKYGGNENLEAIAFLRQLNEAVHERHPGACTIAEESTAWPMVSRPVYVGGLGFDMKWDMGWMNDTLSYMAHDPIHRKFHHDSLTFRMMYAFSESFVLALSHDEVVHGKKSLLHKMPGDYWQKFANLRALYGYMYGLPGKKLLFMGAEIGQWREWSHEAELDWGLLDYPTHRGLQQWVADLNRFYRAESALHSSDFDHHGFRWVDCSDADQSVLCFLRRPRPNGGDTGPAGEPVLVVCNFTPVPRHNYRVGVPTDGTWLELLNSDRESYGGSGLGNPEPLEAVPMAYHDHPHSLCLTLPPLGVIFLKPDQPTTVAAPGPAHEPSDD